MWKEKKETQLYNAHLIQKKAATSIKAVPIYDNLVVPMSFHAFALVTLALHLLTNHCKQRQGLFFITFKHQHG
jgi:hypothetical protein